MNCPICNNDTIKLKTEIVNREFRKEKFKVFEQYYICKKCKKDFTTPGQDDLAITQVYNQYREKYNIPFPEELKSIRDSYNLSATKMSEILGFGINQFRNYEAGELPNKSNSKILNMIKYPNHFKALIEQSKNQFSTKFYDKIVNKINENLKEAKSDSILRQLFSDYLTPNQFNGYKIPSFKKFFNMILFFNENAFYQVRLNKFLFYSDFLNFKKTGKSISGLPYVALKMGPVPDRYKALMDFAEKEGYIEYYYDNSINSNSEKINKRKNFDNSLFNDYEIESMNTVLKNFRYKKTEEIWKLSHQEKAWTENEKTDNKIISYLDYAFQLTSI